MGTLLMDNKELMKEYNYKKNHSIDLNNTTLGSSLKIWWRCKNGTECILCCNCINSCPKKALKL